MIEQLTTTKGRFTGTLRFTTSRFDRTRGTAVPAYVEVPVASLRALPGVANGRPVATLVVWVRRLDTGAGEELTVVRAAAQDLEICAFGRLDGEPSVDGVKLRLRRPVHASPSNGGFEQLWDPRDRTLSYVVDLTRAERAAVEAALTRR